MQTAMAATGPYGVLKELEERIAEDRKYAGPEKAKAHATRHKIIDLVRKANLAGEVRLDERIGSDEGFEEILGEVHRILSGITGTRIPEGMHVFGRIPGGKKRAAIITTILDHNGRLRNLVASMMGLDMRISESETALVRILAENAERLVEAWLDGEDQEDAVARIFGDRLIRNEHREYAHVREEVLRIASMIDQSDELGSRVW